MKKVIVLVAIMAVVFSFGCAHIPESSGNPLAGIQIVPPDPSIPEDLKFFLGYWEGKWINDVKPEYDRKGRLFVSEIISKNEAIISTARETLITNNRIKIQIKRQKDGRPYLETPPMLVTYTAYPEEGCLKAVSWGPYSSDRAWLKRK